MTSKSWDTNKKYIEKTSMNENKQKLIDMFINKSSSIAVNSGEDCIDDNIKSYSKSDQDMEKLKKEFNELKLQHRHLIEQNKKLRYELTQVKAKNYDFNQKIDNFNKEKERQETILNNKIFNLETENNLLQKQNYKFEEEIEFAKTLRSQLKQANNTILQLQNNKYNMQQKPAYEFEFNEFLILLSNILIENEGLNNKANSLMGELRECREEILKLKRLNIPSNYGKINSETQSCNEIQLGQIYKDELSKWVFFVNSNNEYFRIVNRIKLGEKYRKLDLDGKLAIAEILDEEKVIVLEVYVKE